MAAAPSRRFEALDSWRGLAALAVAYRHIGGTSALLANPLHDNLSRAVDFFFVLSGFVIAMSYGDRLAQGGSTGRYMLLRWGRIWPLQATMVLIYLVLEIGLWLKGGGLASRDAFTGPRDLLALPFSFLLLQAWIWPGRDLWNVQSWSVSIELGLYALGALLWRTLGRIANWAGCAIAVAVGAAVFAAGLDEGQIVRGIVGFGLGMGCWAIWPRVRAITLPRWLDTSLECGIVAAMLWAVVAMVPLGMADLLFAAMVLIFAREGGVLSRLLLTAPIRWLGILSYSIYMVHGLIFGRIFDVLGFVQSRVGARWVGSHLGGDAILLPLFPAALLVVAMLASALIAAWFAWRFIEWPARAASRRLAARMPSQPQPAT